MYRKEGEKVAGDPILVADSGNDIATYLAQGGSGQNGACTDIYVLSGKVGFNETDVGPWNKSICGGLPTILTREELFQLKCLFDPSWCRSQRLEAKGGEPPLGPFDPSDEISKKNVRRILKGHDGMKHSGPISGH